MTDPMAQRLIDLAKVCTMPQACNETGLPYQKVYQFAKRNGVQFVESRRKRISPPRYGRLAPKVHCVYAVEAIGLDAVKIGRTSNVETRFRAIKVTTPVPHRFFKVVEAKDEQEASILEKAVLSWTSHLRIHGEWRHLSQEIIEAFDRLPFVEDVTDFCNEVYGLYQHPVLVQNDVSRTDVEIAIAILRRCEESESARSAMRRINGYNFCALDYVNKKEYRQLIDTEFATELKSIKQGLVNAPQVKEAS